MNRLTIAIVALACFSAQTALSMEMTATSREVNNVSPDIRINAESAMLTAAISRFNQDFTSLLRCNNRNMFYKPQDSVADADGCVGATITTTTTNQSVALPAVAFDSYPGHTKSSKGYSGTSTRTIDLSGMVANGALAISVVGTLSGFTGGCAGVTGAKALNIANVNTSVPETENRCHYDSSPNRSSYFYWSYNAANKTLTLRARMSQVKSAPMTNAKLANVRADFTVTKTVLKIGSGK